MPRPPLPLGSWGKISRKQVAPGVWRAITRFRDYDGRTRQVEKRAESGAKAERLLVIELRDRSASTAGQEVTRETRLSAVVPLWWAELEDRDRADNTITRYRDVVDNQILPGVGNLRIREATVTALDRFLKAVREKHGAATAKHAKTILSGILGLAVRHGAADGNPLRDVAPVPVAKGTVRALTVDEARALRAGLLTWQSDSAPVGRKRPQDLLDVVDVMLATGCRIGEALGIRWPDVDLGTQRASVTVNGTVIYVPGEGLKWQSHPKSSSSQQKYTLPGFAVQMLLRRQVEQEEGNAFDVVFPSAAGTLRDPNNFRKQWRQARLDLGFDWVTPHTFRKSVATVLANAEGLAAASAQLGHSSEDVTRRHYVQKAHEAPDHADLLAQFGMDVSR
ncbi:tyrosine-type recombinase/integrase [Arthrobacter sp.]|uniref:tyrosine-type recombinase/integrase n=1 Tax=Arthrobacter sp. TaxID=1667 RepID=UPI003A946DD5